MQEIKLFLSNVDDKQQVTAVLAASMAGWYTLELVIIYYYHVLSVHCIFFVYK